MSKYIDAEKLKEEIEFTKSVYDNPKRVVHGVADAFRQDGRAAMCKDILNKIDSLQQEQLNVDLKKALNDLDNAYFDLDGIAVVGATHYLTVNDLKDIARYFYELGLKAGEK